MRHGVGRAARGSWAHVSARTCPPKPPPTITLQACARRRAALSVAMNPSCSAPGRAAAAVDAVFDACFADTAPFDRIP